MVVQIPPVPRTGKKAFIRAMQQKIGDMKTYGRNVCQYKHEVICESSTSDVAVQTWDITLHNLSGRSFRAYVRLNHMWKNGRSSDIQMPVEIWYTQKEFIAFLEREVDK